MSSSSWLLKTKHWLQMSGPNTSAERSLARGWIVSSSKQRRVGGNKSYLYPELLGSAVCRKAPLFDPNKGFGCLHSGPALICLSLATLGHTVEKELCEALLAFPTLRLENYSSHQLFGSLCLTLHLADVTFSLDLSPNLSLGFVIGWSWLLSLVLLGTICSSTVDSKGTVMHALPSP